MTYFPPSIFLSVLFALYLGSCLNHEEFLALTTAIASPEHNNSTVWSYPDDPGQCATYSAAYTAPEDPRHILFDPVWKKLNEQ